MSVRQDNENKNCPSRGLGIAAAAIGVGVGAALYYLFSKREDPDSSGATSSWSCEREHALSNSSDASFTTISEHSTTDTSMNSTLNTSNDNNETSFSETSYNETSDSSSSNESSDSSESFMDASDTNTESLTDDNHDIITGVESDDETESFIETTLQSDTSFETGYMTLHLNYSINGSSSFIRENTSLSQGYSIDSDTNTEWDVTNSSLDIPNDSRRNENEGRGVRRIIETVRNLASPRVRKTRTEDQQMAILREQAFRERTWTAEECSICFDMMTQTQEVMSLPCTHRFHQACILPWLQERQTCPNCRKTA